MRYRTLNYAVALLLCGSTTTPAWAAPDGGPIAAHETPAASRTPALPESCRAQPWYCGVSERDQERALALYEQGNQLFDDSLFGAAVAKYEQAKKHWDHPGIHYNLMMALVTLDRPIEAYHSSVAALRHGQTALEPEEYRRAQDYQKLLRGRIAELTVTCDEPGAVLSLDGKNILRGPGKAVVYVLPGPHELVARKPGYLPTHQGLTLISARPVAVHMRMLPESQALVTTRAWSAWQPWAVIGAGVGVGLAGGVLEWRASENNIAFQKMFHERCLIPDGCHAVDITSEMESRQRRHRWYRGLGHGALATGGAAVIGGLVLVYLNRPLAMENPERQRLLRVSMTPIVTPEARGLSFDLSF